MWIIQSNFIPETQIKPLVEALREFDIPFLDVGVIPFATEFITPIKLEDEWVIPYGSTTLMRIALKHNWQGLFYHPVAFNVQCWNDKRSDMLNQDAAIMPLKTAIKLLNKMDLDSEWFIRPTDDFKSFNGTVNTAGEILTWLHHVEQGGFNGYRFDNSTLVALSEPLEEDELKAEYRFFVVDRKIVTGSSYRHRGLKLTARVVDGDIISIAQKMADVWLPHDTCVMDVADTSTGWKVIEFNCLNASGFYYHDIRAFVRSVTDYFELQMAKGRVYL